MSEVTDSSKTSKPAQVFLSLQVLRAIAALLVVFSHIRHKHIQNTPEAAHFLDWFNFGAYGVDIFFVISGFIIAYITPVRDFKAGEIKRFMVRRFSRVLPLYWVVTLVALAVWLYDPTKVNSSAPELTRIWESFLLLPTDGRYLYQTGWTLSYEMYFYILAGLTMFVGRAQRIVLPLILVGAILAGIIVQPTSSEPYLFLVTRHHLIEFLGGFLFYHLAGHMIGKKPVLGLYLVTVSLLLIFLHVFGGGAFASAVFFWGWPAMFLVFGLLFMENAVRWPKFFVKMGEASYSLYLTHSFVMAAGALIWYRLFDDSIWSNIGFLIASLSGSIILALLSWRYLEKPMTQWLNARYKKSITKPVTDKSATATSLSANKT